MTLLTVTPEDIAESRKRRTASTPLDRPLPGYNAEQDCPIGIALARRFQSTRETTLARPDYLYVRGSGDSSELTFEATRTIRTYMRIWDRTAQADPHTFRLKRY